VENREDNRIRLYARKARILSIEGILENRLYTRKSIVYSKSEDSGGFGVRILGQYHFFIYVVTVT
jgi:hypothetical protein